MIDAAEALARAEAAAREADRLHPHPDTVLAVGRANMWLSYASLLVTIHTASSKAKPPPVPMPPPEP